MRAGKLALLAPAAMPKAYASGVTSVTDVIVPEHFTPYIQQLTQEKSAIVRSGVLVPDEVLNSNLQGGGLVFNEPSFKDLDDDAENIASATYTDSSTPNKIGTADEKQVRLSRNQSWSSTDLTADLAGADPVTAIANRVSNYWVRRLQKAFVATQTGVFADNDAAPTGTDTHTAGDMTHDISGAVFSDGMTNFSAEGFIDATTTMGDSMGELSLIMVHSVVYARMQKNNLIDFIPDSINGQAVNVPAFLGRRVVVDDGVPKNAGVFESWLFGAGTYRFGSAPPKNATETLRVPSAGNGSGQDIMWSRIQWMIHPVGHAYIGTPPKGGPDNTANANMLAAAGSWSRVYSERKQIRIARLITREF